MKLIPTIAPGRPNRKARAFTAEIARLVMDGYGCKAIHQALTEAGVLVSKSTVQRELARLTGSLKPPPHVASQRQSLPRLPHPTPPAVQTTPSPVANRPMLVDGQRSGKDIAAEFMQGRVTNPLIRNRS